MWLGLLVLLLYVLAVLLITAVVAALLLAIGTALSFLFAVSVWEVTVVAPAVAAGALWLLSTSRLDDLADEDRGQPSAMWCRSTETAARDTAAATASSSPTRSSQAWRGAATAR